jgi:hypothetical protein
MGRNRRFDHRQLPHNPPRQFSYFGVNGVYIAYSLYLERKAAAEAARQKLNVQTPPGTAPPATKP